MLHNFITVFLFSLLNVIIIHLIRKYFPSRYFSLGEFIDSHKSDISYQGIIIRFLPPFLLSIILSYIINDRTEEYVLIFGFLSAFLVAWPVFFIPNQILPTHVYKKLRFLQFLFILFISIHILIASFGYFVCTNILVTIPPSIITNIFVIYFDFKSVFNNLISAMIYSISIGLLFYIYRNIFKVKI